MQLQIYCIMKEIHLWSYEDTMVGQMVFSNATQHPGLHNTLAMILK